MDYGVADRNAAVYGGEHDEEPQYEGQYNEAEEGNYGSIDRIDDSAGRHELKHDSSSSAGKLFVGGIAWETSKESFSRYFGKYGEIIDSVIMMDKITGRPRGFGFVTFGDPEVAENVLLEEHVIDGRAVEVKRTVPREDTQVGGVPKTKKIFVGGIPLSINEDDLREYFSSYGNIVEHQIMLDHQTGRSRGFGFVTFENEDAIDKILAHGRMHELGGKQVEIKRAEPKRSGFDNFTGSRSRFGGSSSKFSGNYASGSKGGFGGGYNSKMDKPYSGYDSYGGYGNFSGNYGGGSAGFYGGYGGYGYGYGFGGPLYNGGAYGGGGFGAATGYGGGPTGYSAGKGYSGGYDGGKVFGGGGGGGYGPAKGYGGGYGGDGYGGGVGGGYGGGGSGGGSYGSGKGYGNGNFTGGRFHPYRK
ncbi:uncharacterized protein [Primulina huaijiensis]|uniref:uncharacterized protein n=1 Tax=Primulina huaijiensis TaxID=1492673 RepID=UPI003CC72E3B